MRAIVVLLIAGGCGGPTTVNAGDGSFGVGDAEVERGAFVTVTSTPDECADDAENIIRASAQSLTIVFGNPDATTATLSQLAVGHYDWYRTGDNARQAANISRIRFDAGCNAMSVPADDNVSGGAGVDVRSVSAAGIVLDFDAQFPDGDRLNGHIEAAACPPAPPPAGPPTCK